MNTLSQIGKEAEDLSANQLEIRIQLICEKMHEIHLRPKDFNPENRTPRNDSERLTFLRKQLKFYDSLYQSKPQQLTPY